MTNSISKSVSINKLAESLVENNLIMGDLHTGLKGQRPLINKVYELVKTRVENAVKISSSIPENQKYRTIHYVTTIAGIVALREQTSRAEVLKEFYNSFKVVNKVVSDTDYITYFEDIDENGAKVLVPFKDMIQFLQMGQVFTNVALHLGMIKEIQKPSGELALTSSIDVTEDEIQEIVKKAYYPIRTSVKDMDTLYGTEGFSDLMLNNPESPYNKSLFKDTQFKEYLDSVNSQQFVLNTKMAMRVLRNKDYAITIDPDKSKIGVNLNTINQTNLVIANRLATSIKEILNNNVNSLARPTFNLLHSFDKRGRMYAIRYELSYQGPEWQKACFKLAKEEPLKTEILNKNYGLSGRDYYLINIANFLGFDKLNNEQRLEQANLFLDRMIQERADVTTSNLDEIAEVVDVLEEKYDYKYDAKLQLIAALENVYSVLKGNEPTDNIVWFDATSSGPQILGAITNDINFMIHTGLEIFEAGSRHNRKDLYKEIFVYIVKAIIKESVGSVQGITVTHVEMLEDFILNDEFVANNRKIAKSFVMQTCYGSKKASTKLIQDLYNSIFNKYDYFVKSISTNVIDKDSPIYMKDCAKLDIYYRFIKWYEAQLHNDESIKEFANFVYSKFENYSELIGKFLEITTQSLPMDSNKVKYTAPDGFEVEYSPKSKLSLALNLYNNDIIDHYDLHSLELDREETRHEFVINGSCGIHIDPEISKQYKEMLGANYIQTYTGYYETNSVELAANFTHTIDGTILRSIIDILLNGHTETKYRDFDQLIDTLESYIAEFSGDYSTPINAENYINDPETLQYIADLDNGKFITFNDIKRFVNGGFYLIKHLTNKRVVKSIYDLMKIMAKIDDKVINIVTVHDCFGVHANYVDLVQDLYNYYLAQLATGDAFKFMVKSFIDKTLSEALQKREDLDENFKVINFDPFKRKGAAELKANLEYLLYKIEKNRAKTRKLYPNLYENILKSCYTLA